LVSRVRFKNKVFYYKIIKMAGKICKHCNFRTSKENLTECPWCGRNSLVKEGSAEELLDEVNDILGDK
jgi:4-hydroxy-3-methylbut-2-en-1-yl diphosphate synthase IspG/GcpE